MAWLFPHRFGADQHAPLEAALSAQALAGEALSEVAAHAREQASDAVGRAKMIEAAAQARIARQQARRAIRERRTQERGVAFAVDDTLRLPSFGGPDNDEG